MGGDRDVLAPVGWGSAISLPRRSRRCGFLRSVRRRLIMRLVVAECGYRSARPWRIVSWVWGFAMGHLGCPLGPRAFYAVGWWVLGKIVPRMNRACIRNAFASSAAAVSSMPGWAASFGSCDRGPLLGGVGGVGVLVVFWGVGGLGVGGAGGGEKGRRRWGVWGVGLEVGLEGLRGGWGWGKGRGSVGVGIGRGFFCGVVGVLVWGLVCAGELGGCAEIGVGVGVLGRGEGEELFVWVVVVVGGVWGWVGG